MPRPRFTALDPDKRRAILEAAADEFARDGFDGASYNQIIARAGISKGAMYYYFDDKADLYLTTIGDVIERMFAAVGSLRDYDDAASFWAAIRDLSGRMIGFIAEEPRLPGLAKSLLSADPALAEALAAYIDQTRAFMAGLIAEGRALGAVRDDLPEPLLASLLTGLGEAFDRYLLARWGELSEAEMAALPDQIVDLYIRLAAPLDLAVELTQAGAEPTS
ncbi:MAG: TetR/AcrR family transcriptional regulator [Myxococcales bacterium]|nr:TetR/AcrR family transcriptional regulator [Myxococcales bacterium]